jgi:Skp family chaperone for outer membrane proteins
MKSIHRTVLAALVIGVIGSVTALADVGVVDMERLIKLHPRTRADRAILQQYVADFEAEREEMMEVLQKLSDEFEQLRKEAEDVGLSEKALDETRTLAKSKMTEMRQTEQKLRETAATRQKELTSQELRMRKRVVADIRDIVETIAKKKRLELVLDATGVGIGGYSQVLYYEDKYDITDDVVSQMPKAKDDE